MTDVSYDPAYYGRNGAAVVAFLEHLATLDHKQGKALANAQSASEPNEEACEAVRAVDEGAEDGPRIRALIAAGRIVGDVIPSRGGVWMRVFLAAYEGAAALAVRDRLSDDDFRALTEPFSVAGLTDWVGRLWSSSSNLGSLFGHLLKSVRCVQSEGKIDRCR